MDAKILEKIGLTEGEVRVYLALLKLGLCSTGQIIEKSHITSSKVYLILERLERKGLVSHVIKNNVKHFQAANPQRLLNFMDEKKSDLANDTEEIKDLIPLLQTKMEQVTNPQEVVMYQGPKGFHTARDEFISNLKRGDEYCVFGAENPFGEVYKNTIDKFNSDNEKKGIRTRLIYNIKNAKMKKLFSKYKLARVKIVTTQTPSSIAVSKDKILLMAYGENPIQVLIHSEVLASSFLRFFESVWKTATT
jgi:HTH-type transcriptional regulator, sugar sensing transcriptional regulator